MVGESRPRVWGTERSEKSDLFGVPAAEVAGRNRDTNTILTFFDRKVNRQSAQRFSQKFVQNDD